MESDGLKALHDAQPDYMILFRGSEWTLGCPPDEMEALMNNVMEWFEGLYRQNKVKLGHPLTDETSLVSHREGQTVVDGPFAETKEAIGGFLILNVETREEAIEIAASGPWVPYGMKVEVRQIATACPLLARVKQLAAAETA
ncbi:MAG: YciI family protein [Verrucomicrobiota bacterium JB022]|nr:YciI family protein [Verrucomicrobiota bacterium JB022]